MTLEPDRKNELDDRLMESLLRETYASNLDDEHRISAVMEQLEASPTSLERPPKTTRRTWSRWASLAVAASLLVAAAATYSLVFDDGGNRAYAAVMRSLSSIPATRHYRLSMVNQRPDSSIREVTSQIYLDDGEHFVVQHPSWLGRGSVWIGGDSSERWIVPRFGPVLSGDEPVLGKWLANKNLPTPYLHMTTLLKRMSRKYDLEMLPDESIPSLETPSRTIACQHVLGTIRQQGKNLPESIELWASVESGVAQRVVLKWQRTSAEPGPLEWTIDLVGRPDLPDDWFEIRGHARPRQRILRTESDQDLEFLNGNKAL